MSARGVSGWSCGGRGRRPGRPHVDGRRRRCAGRRSRGRARRSPADPLCDAAAAGRGTPVHRPKRGRVTEPGLPRARSSADPQQPVLDGERGAGDRQDYNSQPPAGSRFSSQEGIGEPSSSSSGWQEERSFPGQTGKVTSELLEITTAPASGGGTAIRADAIVLWRPTWEQVPAARTPRGSGSTVSPSALSPGPRRRSALVNTAPVVAPGAYRSVRRPRTGIGITFIDARGFAGPRRL